MNYYKTITNTIAIQVRVFKNVVYSKISSFNTLKKTQLLKKSLEEDYEMFLNLLGRYCTLFLI